MRKSIGAIVIVVLCFAALSDAVSQECKALQNSSMDELVSFLDNTIPDQANAECVTFAIKSIGNHRYEPAVGVLTKLLDFRRPPNIHEKHHVLLHPQITEEMYPATGALEEIGESASPAVLDKIKNLSSSPSTREKALTVWMEIHKYNATQAVVLLKEEAIKADDRAVKDNLTWALSKAPSMCDPKNRARCRAAAVIPAR